MSLRDCLKRVGLGEFEAALLQTDAQALTDEGIATADAARRSVQGLLDTYTQERADIVAQIEAQGVSMAVSPEVLAQAEVVEGYQIKEDVVLAEPVPTTSKSTIVVNAKTGEFKTGLTRVTSPEEALHVIAPLRKSPQELMIALVLDKNANVLQVISHTKGLADVSQVDIGVLVGSILAVPESAQVYFAHNHPAGDPKQSRADKNITGKLAQLLEGTGVWSHGMVVIGEGRRGSYFKDDSAADSVDVTPVAAARTKSVPITERVFRRRGKLLNQVVSGSASAKAIVKQIAGKKSGVLLLDNKHIPVSFVPMTVTELSRLRTGEKGKGSALLLQEIHSTNARALILNLPEDTESAMAVALNVGGFANATGDTRMLDVIIGERSLADEGASFNARETFFQKARGYYEPYQNMIKLLAKADPTTYLHESGHVWLEELRTDATHPNAPEQLKQDWATVKEWTGATDEAISRDAHEQFARGIEAYVMEGNSPSQGLREIFSQFREWLKRIYKTMGMLDVELTDEVRDVMDRLVATDEAIQYMRDQNLYEFPMFSSEAMTSKEALVYQALNTAAKQEAEDSFRAKIMRALKREDSAQWRKDKEVMAKVVRAELLETPLYKAAYWLQNGTLPDGTLIDGLNVTKLDKQLVKDQGYKLNELPRRITQEAGLHPDVVADAFGFESGEQMLRTMHKVPTLLQAVEIEATARMQETHETRMSDEDFMAQAAIEVQNAKQVEVFQFELRILKRLGARREQTHPAVLKDLSEQIIQRKVVGELRPYQYRDAANKAAQRADEAFLARDFDAAFDAKQQQLLNIILHRRAEEVRQEINKKVKRWHKQLFRSDKKLAKLYNLDMINAARAIAASHAIGRSEETANTYMQAIKLYDPQTYEDMAGIVELATSNSKPVTEITVADFSILRDSLDGLLALARRSQQVLIDDKLINRATIIGELNDRITEITKKPRKKAGYNRTLTRMEKFKVGLVSTRAALRRVEHWVDAMDHGDPSGVFRSYIWQPVREAGAEFAEARVKTMQRYLEIVNNIGPEITAGNISAPELEFEFADKAELLGAMLHTGNESNLQKLLRGREWGAYTETGELNTARWDTFIKRMWAEGTLNEKDYDFIQAIWDLMEDLKPGAQKAHREMYGYYFDEITAQPIETPFGTYKGGYIPAMVDTYAAEDAALRSEKEIVEHQPTSFMFPTTGRGFSMKRVEQYAKPLVMDLGLVSQHIQKVLRFTHLEPRIKDVGRIVIDTNFREVLRTLDSEVASNMLMPWLQRTALQQVETPSTTRAGRVADKFFSGLRRRTGLNIMFANVSVALQQYTGLSLAVVMVKPRYLAGALGKYVKNPQAYKRQISEASVFMRNRVTTQAMEVQQFLDEILLNPSKFEKAVNFANKHGYFMQTATQSNVDVITWGGAYDQALTENPDAIRAVRIADTAVRETQGSFEAVDISKYEANAPFIRALHMFYSFFNMAANLNATEFVKASREMGVAGARRAFYAYLFAFAIPAILAEGIVQAIGGDLFDDDDDDGYLDNLLSVLVGGQVRMLTAMVPVAGPLSQAGINKFNDRWYDDRISTSPVMSSLEALAYIPYDIYQLGAKDDPRLKPIIRRITMDLGLITGLPVAPLSRPLGYLIDIEQGYVEPENELDYARGLISGRAPQ